MSDHEPGVTPPADTPAPAPPVRGGQIACRYSPVGDYPTRVAFRGLELKRGHVVAFVASRTIRTLHLSPEGEWYVFDHRAVHHPEDAARALARVQELT